jgi:5-methylthioribose kinase
MKDSISRFIITERNTPHVPQQISLFHATTFFISSIYFWVGGYFFLFGMF